MFLNLILSLFSRNCFEKQLMKPHLLQRLEADQLSPASNAAPKDQIQIFISATGQWHFSEFMFLIIYP